ncbi:MAG: hypothetical protein R3C39_10510 [Dehalococcoidia bacterium]
MWHWHGDWDGGDWLGMVVMMALVWTPLLLVALAILRGPRRHSDSERRSEERESAEEVARRAYANGEIDRERFLEVMSDLREHPASPRG